MNIIKKTKPNRFENRNIEIQQQEQQRKLNAQCSMLMQLNSILCEQNANNYQIDDDDDNKK